MVCRRAVVAIPAKEVILDGIDENDLHVLEDLQPTRRPVLPPDVAVQWPFNAMDEHRLNPQDNGQLPLLRTCRGMSILMVTDWTPHPPTNQDKTCWGGPHGQISIVITLWGHTLSFDMLITCTACSWL